MKKDELIKAGRTTEEYSTKLNKAVELLDKSKPFLETEYGEHNPLLEEIKSFLEVNKDDNINIETGKPYFSDIDEEVFNKPFSTSEDKPIQSAEDWLIEKNYPEVMQGITRESLADILNHYASQFKQPLLQLEQFLQSQPKLTLTKSDSKENTLTIDHLEKVYKDK